MKMVPAALVGLIEGDCFRSNFRGEEDLAGRGDGRCLAVLRAEQQGSAETQPILLRVSQREFTDGAPHLLGEPNFRGACG